MSNTQNNAAASSEQFQAYYLQRATAELAEDLDTLRTAKDFKMGGDKANGSNNSSDHSGDNPLQILVGALRQGADMFVPADQQRVAKAAGEDKTAP